jgi:Cytochrome P450
MPGAVWISSPCAMINLSAAAHVGQCSRRVILTGGRRHPVTCCADSNGKEHDIPKGDICCTSPAFQHRMQGLFKDAERYDHTRFLPPRSEEKAAKFTFIGFGGGRHGCMGTNFAYMQIKTVRLASCFMCLSGNALHYVRLVHLYWKHALLRFFGRAMRRRACAIVMCSSLGLLRPGLTYKYMRIRVQVWSYLLRNFEFELLDPIPDKDLTCLVVGPKPCRAQFKRRPLL